MLSCVFVLPYTFVLLNAIISIFIAKKHRERGARERKKEMRRKERGREKEGRGKSVNVNYFKL